MAAPTVIEERRAALQAFERLIGLDAPARDSALAELAVSHPSVHVRLVRLLDADAQAERDDRLAGVLAMAMHDLPARSDLAAGQAFGPYRLERPLGAGGMGEVWLASRSDGLYEGHVAIKTLHLHLARSAARERFAREGRILARLTHPHIARLLDAGVAQDGQPFLVIEHVEGERLDHWCDRHKRSLRERFTLFLHVCEAVAHAHAHLVVHRDLKPSNILVTPTGEVKLLDFGIAKLLEGSEQTTPSAEQSELTHVGGRVLTPEYAAPEQILGTTVTTATDVYALGVVLYLLVCGRLPFESRNERSSALLEQEVLAGAIRVPSARVGATDEVIAAARQSTPPLLRRAIRGDADSIILKAMRGAPADRYPSVLALAEDLRRHLSSEPVQARAGVFSYRAGRYMRRHRVGVAVAALVFLAILAGIAGTAWEAREARQQAVIAEAHADEAREIADFQGAMLQRVDVQKVGAAWFGRARDRIRASLVQDESRTPAQSAQDLATFDALIGESQPSEVARETLGEYVLEPAEAEIGHRFGDRPGTAGALRASLGSAYIDLGLFPQAIAELKQAIAQQSAAQGEDDPVVLASRLALAQAQEKSGDYAASVVTAQGVVEARERVLGPDHPDTLASRDQQAAMLVRSGDYAGAIKLLEPLLVRTRQVLGNEHPETLETELNLAIAMSSNGDSAGALPLAQAVLAVRERTFGKDDRRTFSAMNEIVFDDRDLGDYAGSRAMNERLLSAQRRTLGDGHPDTIKTLANLAVVVGDLGESATALRLRREAWLVAHRSLGDDHPITLANANNYAAALADEGDYHAASALIQRVLANRRRVLGPEHPLTLHSAGTLGRCLGAERRFDEARTLLEATLASEQRILGPDHRFTIETRAFLARLTADEGHPVEALALDEALEAALRGIEGPQGRQTLSTGTNIGTDLRNAGKLEASRARLESTLAGQRQAFGLDAADCAETQLELSETLHGLHRDAEARDQAAQAVASMRRTHREPTAALIEAIRLLARRESALGHRTEARQLEQEAVEAERKRSELDAEAADAQ